MVAADTLRKNEQIALNNNQFISNVSGKNSKFKSTGKIKAFGAMAFLTAMIIVFAILFSSGNIIPSAISERLIEETDVQYADAVESKKIVFQQALKSGEIPEDTAKILKDNKVLVGYFSGGSFIESNNNPSGELVLIVKDEKVVTADDFIAEVGINLDLYNAFNLATYSRAAYYYDESAMKVFRKIGTNRNNYREDSEFDKVMSEKLGEGSNIDVNNVGLFEKKRINEETGEEEVYYEYDTFGEDVSSRSAAEEFINEVVEKSFAKTSSDATLDAASSIRTADTIAKEQRSETFFLTFMENISKMKAGDGNDSKINDAMNYLYEDAKSEVVDIKTGQIVESYGTPLDSPSLYAVLSGNKMEPETVENYSSERILSLVKNHVSGGDSKNSITNTVTSTGSKSSGSIGRFIEIATNKAENAPLSLATPTVSDSLMDNSFKTINGIKAGEFLVEGAVNVGKELAKASGGSAGDSKAVAEYSRLNSKILAMDAAVDRINRSPFDVTSKNTFLGSIFYNLAILINKESRGILSNINSFSNLVKNSVVSLLPSTVADSATGYLTAHGNCETIQTINAVGSAQCSEIAVFDASTLNDPFNNAGFIAFVEANTVLNSNGTREVIGGSDLSDFILYNDERVSPLGVVDGGILESLGAGSSSISFISDILGMIKRFLGATEIEKRIASGAAFVNSNSNPDWNKYKYAQRYVSLARATEALRKYAGDSTAYNNILYFEGDKNPVVAFLDEYYKLAEGN